LCSHFDLLTDGRWLQQAGNTPKKWVGAILLDLGMRMTMPVYHKLTYQQATSSSDMIRLYRLHMGNNNNTFFRWVTITFWQRRTIPLGKSQSRP
jgi:hypothetical protein